MPAQNQQPITEADRSADFSKQSYGASYMPLVPRPQQLTPWERQQVVDRSRIPLSAALGTYIPIVGNLVGSAIGRHIGNKRADRYLQGLQQQADAQNAQIQQNNAIFQGKQKYFDSVLGDQAVAQNRPDYGPLPTGMSPEEYRLNIAPTVDSVGERTLGAQKDFLASQRIEAQRLAAQEAGQKRANVIAGIARTLKPYAPAPAQQPPTPGPQTLLAQPYQPPNATPAQPYTGPQQMPYEEPYAQDYGPNPYEQQPLQGGVAETTVPSANIPNGMDLIRGGYGTFTPAELLNMETEMRQQADLPISDFKTGVGARKDLATAANTELDTSLDRRYGPAERQSTINSRNASAVASQASASASQANAQFRNYANGVLRQMTPAQRAMFITREGTVYADPQGNIVPQMDVGTVGNGDIVIRGKDGKLHKVTPVQLGAPRE